MNAGSRAAQISIFLLFLLVPFEPRFTVPLGPLRVSLLEAVSLVVFAVLMAVTRREPRPSLASARPLFAIASLFVAALLSAATTPDDAVRPFKFALRMGAMTLCAFLAARLRDAELRWAFGGLAVAGTGAAALALLEGWGVRSLDVLLGVFREIPFNVAGARRASAGSEYPNLGAAMIVYALIAGVVLLRSRTRVRGVFVLILAGGLVFTYSRGAWLAGLAALVCIGLVEDGQPRTRFVPAAILLAVIVLFLARAEISQLRLGGENANDFYAATYETPAMFAMDASARIVVPVTLKNVGRRPWRAADQIHLSYHLYQGDRRPLVDGPRTDLPIDVLPGQSVTINAILRAPAAPGEYLLMWDLVHEDTTWFSGQGVRPGVARVLVGSNTAGGSGVSEEQAIRAIPEGLAWRPSRLELWDLAFEMWRAHPLLGVGPDNFRWTYGTLAGKAAFDTRVFANNLFLEIAATMGTLGIACLLVAMASALWAGFRMAPASDVSLAAFAIVVAMSIHGLADYLLAFTGHYLVFGMALGVLSRPPRSIQFIEPVH